MAIIYTDTASIKILDVITVTSQTASFSYISGSVTTSGGLTGSLQGTASYATQALSASYATTASYYGGSVNSASYAGTASYVSNAQTASYVLNAISSSFSSTASYVQNSQTASYVVNAQSASYVQNAVTASYIVTAQTASYVNGNIHTSTNPALTASYAQTASYIQNAQSASYVLQAVSASFTSTASFVQNAQTASYILQAVSASFATSSSYSVSSSYALSASWSPSSTATTPGGTTTQIQYNNAGTFGGATNVGINTNNLQLVSTTDPTSPSAGNLLVYSRTIAGRPVAKVLNSVGLSYPLQSAFWQNTQYTWTTTGATNGLWTNTAGAGAGTFAATNPTTTNIFTSQKRSRYSNVITTLNQVLGQRNTDAVFFRGGAAGQGGFFFYARLGFDTWTNGSRFFAGMATATTIISADPSALNNTVGFAVDAADNGLINFLTRDTAATKQSTGLTIVSNKGYDVFIFCKPNDTVVYYRILDIVAGTEYTNSATLTLPVNTTLLTANVLASNAALTAANATQLSVSKIYIETEY